MNSTQFREAIQAAGMEPPHYLDPGKMYRFPGLGKSRGNTAGWCKLFDDTSGGVFGDFSSGFSSSWHAQRATSYSAEEMAAFKRRAEESRTQAYSEREAKSNHAASQSAEILKNAKPCEGHPYLDKKQIQSHLAREQLADHPDCKGWFWSTKHSVLINVA